MPAMDKVLEWLLGLLKEKLGMLIVEISEEVLKYIDDENALDEYVKSLTGIRRIIAESIINFVKALVAKLIEIEELE